MADEQQPTVFISYCQSDGSAYADDLESQLSDYFTVRRDKSALAPNDDIYLFMGGIAEEDYVVIILTENYLESLNCMLEMSYLLEQPDWSDKAIVLVIDAAVYGLKRKLEVVSYWKLRQDELEVLKNDTSHGKTLVNVELEYVRQINAQVETFLLGLSKKLNPSQIAVVNELARKLKASRERRSSFDVTSTTVRRGEEKVKELLNQSGSMTIGEISTELGNTRAYTSRLIRRLLEAGQIRADSTSARNKRFCIDDSAAN